MRTINAAETHDVKGGFNPLGLAAISALSCAIVLIGSAWGGASVEETLTLLTVAFVGCNVIAFLF